jgi:DnaK suppressor protein
MRTQGSSSTSLPEALLRECRAKLVNTRQDILNRVRTARAEFDTLDKSGGDEADQTMSLLAEQDFLAAQRRMTELLFEIDSALARIDNGTYGLCEETEEVIEFERLRALPWTRLSIEGAEIREAMQTRFAR